MAGRPTVVVDIGGDKYEIAALSAVEGRRVYLRLIKLLGPALGKIANGDKLPAQDKLLGAVTELLAGLDEADLDLFCDSFGNATNLVTDPRKRITLDRATFGEHFCGKYADMTRWLVECVKVNKFLDFLSGS